MRGFFMFKKIKKHRLSLLLLAMVAMLSVYYVLMPQDGPLAPVGGDGDTNTRYQDFAEMRLLILDERNKEVALYEAKITEATVSLNDIEEYLLEIETISTLTEKEVYRAILISTLKTIKKSLDQKIKKENKKHIETIFKKKQEEI